MMRHLLIALLFCSTPVSAGAGRYRKQMRAVNTSKRLDIRMVNARNGVPLKRAEAALAWGEAAAGWSPRGIIGGLIRELLSR